MKWIKRIFVFLLILAIGLAALLGTSFYLLHRTPDWYKPLVMDSQEMKAAANRAFSKMTAVHNMANEASAATHPDVKPVTITFTQEELTAFILSWNALNSDTAERYIKGPQFALRDGQIIFGGQITELGQFGALHLEPSIDEKGLLHLDIIEIRAGQLRVPQSFIENHLTKARTTLEHWLP